MLLYDFFINLSQNELASLDAQLNKLLPAQTSTIHIIETLQTKLHTDPYRNDIGTYLKKYLAFLNLLKNTAPLAKKCKDLFPLIIDLQKKINTELFEVSKKSLRILYHNYYEFQKTIPTTIFGTPETKENKLKLYQASHSISNEMMNELVAYMSLVDIVIDLESLPITLMELPQCLESSVLYFQAHIQTDRTFVLPLATLLANEPELNHWLLDQSSFENSTIQDLQLELHHQENFIDMLDSALEFIEEKNTALQNIQAKITTHTKPNKTYVELYAEFLQVMQDWAIYVKEFSNDFYKLSPNIQAQYPELSEALDIMEAKKISLLEKCKYDWENTGYGFQAAINLKLSKTPELKTWIFEEITNLAPNLAPAPVVLSH